MNCNVCNKHRKSKKTKMLYVFKKALSLLIVHSNCGQEYENVFRGEQSI